MLDQSFDFWENLSQSQKLMPIAAIDQQTLALEWAEFLLNLEFHAIEITLRTENSLKIFSEVKRVFGNDLKVGAGSILNEMMADQAINAGADFIVSPGSTDEMLHYFQDKPFPWLPGVATLSESLNLTSHGFNYHKFFPANTLGGIATLSAWSLPCKNLKLCPTGGITHNDVNDYLSLDCVFMVGASALAPKNKEDTYQKRVKEWLLQLS